MCSDAFFVKSKNNELIVPSHAAELTSIVMSTSFTFGRFEDLLGDHWYLFIPNDDAKFLRFFFLKCSYDLGT